MNEWMDGELCNTFVPSMEILVLSGSSVMSSSKFLTAPLLPCFFVFVLEIPHGLFVFTVRLLFDVAAAGAFLFA
jgi:hypothetical protein